MKNKSRRKYSANYYSKPLRVKLDLTMREAGILHSILTLVYGGDLEEVHKRKLKVGLAPILNKLNNAEDRSLADFTQRNQRNFL